MKKYRRNALLGISIMLTIYILGIIIGGLIALTPSVKEADPIMGILFGALLWTLAMIFGIYWCMDMIRELAEDLLREAQ
ncbi:MAG TPA: hypothetical protein ENK81_00605 [Euryarchaeota archaeon]|nr:hypothetical protein [Euryarchaeota archaeon]